MKRVLQIYGEILSNGGQEAYSMNMYRNINREKVQFDFYTPYYCDNENLVREIEQLGGKVYTGGGKFELEIKKIFIRIYQNSFLTILMKLYILIQVVSLP